MAGLSMDPNTKPSITTIEDAKGGTFDEAETEAIVDATSEGDSRSHAMGLHVEPLKGRDIKTMFSLENEGGYAYAFAPDVDFNKRASIDCEGKEATQINGEIDRKSVV